MSEIWISCLFLQIIFRACKIASPTSRGYYVFQSGYHMYHGPARQAILNTGLPWVLKGIVHQKTIFFTPFTHAQVVPNLYECLCSAEHKGRYSEECGKQSSSGAPLTSIVFFSYNGSQGRPGYKNSLVTNFLQNIFLCVQQNKDIHTGWELLEGE